MPRLGPAEAGLCGGTVPRGLNKRKYLGRGRLDVRPEPEMVLTAAAERCLLRVR